MTKENEVIFEVKKELSISSIMQLIDLNGSKKNFQSEFILETTDPSKKVSVCVVNQDELDNGKINFEETERGKYSRRVTYQNDKHINHYIGIKKHPSDNDDKNIDCVLIIHMKELPPIKKEVLYDDEEEIEMQTSNLNNLNNNLNPNMSDDTKEDIRKNLFNLREDNPYNNMPDTNETENNVEESVLVKSDKKSTFMNSYFFIGIILLCIFSYIFYVKKIKKH